MHGLANTNILSLCQVIRPAAFDIRMALTQTRIFSGGNPPNTKESRGQGGDRIRKSAGMWVCVRKLVGVSWGSGDRKQIRRKRLYRE